MPNEEALLFSGETNIKTQRKRHFVGHKETTACPFLCLCFIQPCCFHTLKQIPTQVFGMNIDLS